MVLPRSSPPWVLARGGCDCRRAVETGLKCTSIPGRGDPLRILYAFDPRRTAILLIGGDKFGGNRWYETNVPIADRLFERHLRTVKEGEDHG